MNCNYRIGEINIYIESDCDYQINRMKPFQINGIEDIDLYIKMKQNDLLSVEGEIIMQDDGAGWMVKENKYISFSKIIHSKEILSVLEVEKDWMHASIEYTKKIGLSLPNGVDYGDFNAFHMAGVLFRYTVINHQGIVIHASSIEFNGKGIAFTAPAGTGKSTHVELWEKYFGDRINILNDDTPVLKLKENGVYLFGTPWSGSSDKFMNKSVPLSAIVIIERAENNSIRRMAKNEATVRLMPRFFFPYFDKGLMEKAVKIYEKIISQTPVYLLKCTPDKQAVEVLNNKLKSDFII